jgi:hypothetical protein
MRLQKNKFTSIYFAIFIFSFVLFFETIQLSALHHKHNNRQGNWEKIFGEKDKVICVSIPKAGTHLLIKCLTLLDIDGIAYNYDTEKEFAERLRRPYSKITVEEYAERAFARLTYRINKNKNLRRSYLVHLPYHEKYHFFFQNFTVANFLMIRDPRDQLISLAATSLKDPMNREVGLEETLLDLLEKRRRHIPWERRHGACDLMWTLGITEFYHAFLKWESEPNFCLIRFENLIGEQGGGTLEAQINEIKKIASHIGIEPSDDQIMYAVNNLYGETRTFKKGQSKAWKKYFTPKVVKAFKNVPGACQLLIDLGYEQDSEW